MRLVSTLLFVALTGSIAVADDANPNPQPEPQPVAVVAKAKVPLRVVRVLEETSQALLFDKTKGAHVLAEVGSTIEGYTVQDIDDDEVTLVGENGTQVVLAAPDWRRHHDDAPTHAKPAAPKVATVNPTAAMAPIDPYAEPTTETRTVDAPHVPEMEGGGLRPTRVIDAGDGGVRVAEAPGVPAPAPVAASPAPPAPAPAPVATPPVVTAALAVPTPALTPPVDAPLLLPRAEVAAALSNFSKLASSVHGAFTPAGVKLESIVAGSLFAKVGLRAGDVVATVNNKPLHSIDDAAELYARAGSARNVSIQLTRAGQPITLHLLIQ